MARFGVETDFVDNTKKITKNMRSTMQEAMTDVTLDLKRVASASTPHKSGHLEKQGQHNISVTSKDIVGTVGFSAYNKGFNYAEWTHDKNYNLGEKSKKKSGGKSKFGSGTVPVGTGYLENALSYNESGYLKHLEDAYGRSLNN